MMNLMQGMGDDQVALIGCLVALVGSAALMYVSYFVGPASRQQKSASKAEIRQMPRPVESTRERAA